MVARSVLVSVASALALSVSVVFVCRSNRHTAIAKDLMRDCHLIVDRYIEAVDDSQNKTVPHRFSNPEDYFEFSNLCKSNNCHISCQGDTALEGKFFGKYFEVSHMYPSWEHQTYPSESYSLGYVRVSGNHKRPVVNYIKRYEKDGHKVVVDFWKSFANDPNVRDL